MSFDDDETKKAKDLNRNEILDVCRFISCFGLFEENFALKTWKFIWKVRTIRQDQTILFIQRWDEQKQKRLELVHNYSLGC